MFLLLSLAGLASAQLPPTTWNLLSGSGAPTSARSEYAVAIIPPLAGQNPQLMLYGGKDAGGIPHGETWFLDIASPTSAIWLQAGSSASPGPRSGHAMVFDPTRGGVVLFGGRTPTTGLMNDTWLWNGIGWAQLQLGGLTPPRLENHEMVFDSSTGDIVLFGGRDATGAATSATMTLRLSLNQWVTQAPTTVPPARFAQGMAFDSVRRRVVMFGGVDGPTLRNDVWQFETATATWTQHTQPSAISGGGRAEATYDLARGRVVFFTSAFPSPLYEFDGSVAMPRNGAPPNGSSGNSAFAYEAKTKTCFYFAGIGGTWTYRPSTFSSVTSTGSSNCVTSNNLPLILKAQNGNEWQSAASALPRNVVMSNLVPSTTGFTVFAGLLASFATTSPPLGPCLQLLDSPVSFPIQVVDSAGSDLLQSFGFPAGYAGTTVHYQFAMLDPVLGAVLSNRLTIVAGSTL